MKSAWRGEARGIGAEAHQVGARAAGLHELDAAAGEAEQQVVERARAGQVDEVVELARVEERDVAAHPRVHRPCGHLRADLLLLLLVRVACSAPGQPFAARRRPGRAARSALARRAS